MTGSRGERTGAPVIAGRRRHVPERTCIACRRARPQRELIRLVRAGEDPADTVRIDLRGRAPGRGAYLCPERPCWERALVRGALARALRTALSTETRAALEAYAKTLDAPDPGEGEPQP